MSSLSGTHDATASMLGYLYQCRYALLAALDEVKRNPGHSLSIERFDDIAFETQGTPEELIQTKHHSASSDLSDNSVDVWKTLLIWMKRANDSPESISRVRFVLLTTASAAENSAMMHLRASEEHRDVAKAIELLRQAAKQSKNSSTQSARKMLLELDEVTCALLFSNVWVFDLAPNIIDARVDIENVLTFSAPVGKIETFTNYLEGWWFSRIISGLANEQSPSISLSSLLSKISEIRENFRPDGLPLSPGIENLVGPLLEDDDQRLLVRQMRSIDLDKAPIAAAVQDYYKAYTQRSKWAREELLLDEEAQRYEGKLCDALERELYARQEAEAPTDDLAKKNVGRQLFHWSTRHSLPLRNRDELWLSSGSFQMLSDRGKIGWHVDYRTLFAIKEAAE